MASQNKFAPQYICRRRNYTNNLPVAQLSCPVKFLNLPFQSIERYAKCGITKLEEDYKYEVWPEDILKHCPPLVDLNIFKRNEDAVLDPKDAYLLEDDFAVQTNSKRSQQHSKIVPWMRKTEYISTEFNRYGVKSDRSENKVGYSIKRKLGNQDNMYKDKISQIRAIDKIFNDTSKPVKNHYSKPGVFAVEEIMLLPDEAQARYSCAHVIFDADPMPSTKDSNKLQERAVLKGMKDHDGSNFVAYFVPTEETLEQKLAEEADGLDYTPGYEYKYICGREYSWTVQNKQTHGPEVEVYFFTQREGTMYYCEVDTRVKLNRRSKPSSTSRNSILLLSHRDYLPDELQIMNRRLNKLYDPYITGEYVPLEEEEQEEEDDEIEQTGGNAADQNKKAKESSSEESSDDDDVEPRSENDEDEKSSSSSSDNDSLAD